MSKPAHNNKGFGTFGVLAIIVVLVAIGGAGAYVWHRDHKARPDAKQTSSTQTTTSKSSSSTQSTGSTGTQQSYLIVKELGIRITLSSAISSAYYQVKSTTKNDKPVIALYLHSLDSYPQCTPTNNSDGVAEVLTYTPGQTDGAL